jgi:hypothetical protein
MEEALSSKMLLDVPRKANADGHRRTCPRNPGTYFTIAVPLLIKRLKRPSLEITAAEWRTPGPLIRTFAVVRIRNKPVARPFRFLRREVAQGCVVEIDFRQGANRDRVFPPIRGRWSSHPQPISNTPSRGMIPYAGSPASGTPIPYAGGTIDPDIHRGVATGDVQPSSGGTASTFRYAGDSSPVPYAGGTVSPVPSAGGTVSSRTNYAPSSYDPTLDPAAAGRRRQRRGRRSSRRDP